MLGLVDVDERAQQIAILGASAIIVGSTKHRTQLVQEDLMPGLNLEHVGVFGDRPKAVETQTITLDPMHRIFLAKQSTGRIEASLICISTGIHKDVTGAFAHVASCCIVNSDSSL